MGKNKKGRKIGTTKEIPTQTSFSSSSISSLESENVLAMDLDQTELEANYSNKERMDAQVDSLRLLNQVNIDIEHNYDQLQLSISGNMPSIQTCQNMTIC